MTAAGGVPWEAYDIEIGVQDPRWVGLGGGLWEGEEQGWAGPMERL